jgi:hypothetical protein
MAYLAKKELGRADSWSRIALDLLVMCTLCVCAVVLMSLFR